MMKKTKTLWVIMLLQVIALAAKGFRFTSNSSMSGYATTLVIVGLFFLMLLAFRKDDEA